MDADNSFYVKFIATEALTFFGYIISVLAMVIRLQLFNTIPTDTGLNQPSHCISHDNNIGTGLNAGTFSH
jgi:hypothetical protein